MTEPVVKTRASVEDDVLLSVRGLSKHYHVRMDSYRQTSGTVMALDDFSVEIRRGETLSLVGESGCGKSTAGFTILQLHKPSGGQVFYLGRDLAGLDEKALRKVRQKLQVIFQDPYSTLNPRMTIGTALAEPLLLHRQATKAEVPRRVEQLLADVGLSPRFAARYPHELSGGQRQRAVIARALACGPEFIVCDEPISALDVSVQAQIINLFQDLQDRWGLTYLFIAHDLSVVRHISDRVAVMYLGRMAELALKSQLFEDPLHPYTKALLSAVPEPNPERERSRRRQILSGDVPSPINPPSGCRFHTRCPIAMPKCREIVPEWRQAKPEHWVACHAVEGA